MYEQEGEADRQGNLKSILLWLHDKSNIFSLENVAPYLQLMATYF